MQKKMKLLKSKCVVCQAELQTGYKNAYCIPPRPRPVVCPDCEDGTLPKVDPDYYKYCDQNGCQTITYRVSLRRDAAGNVADKKITKRKCSGCRRPA